MFCGTPCIMNNYSVLHNYTEIAGFPMKDNTSKTIAHFFYFQLTNFRSFYSDLMTKLFKMKKTNLNVTF